jgi:hypothetical protein
LAEGASYYGKQGRVFRRLAGTPGNERRQHDHANDYSQHSYLRQIINPLSVRTEPAITATLLFPACLPIVFSLFAPPIYSNRVCAACPSGTRTAGRLTVCPYSDIYISSFCDIIAQDSGCPLPSSISRPCPTGRACA